MFKITTSIHNCNCRICGKLLPKHKTLMVRIEPHRSKAGVFICEDCVDNMKNRMDYVKKEEEKDDMESSKCPNCDNIGFTYDRDFENGNGDIIPSYKCNTCGEKIS